MRNVWIGLMFGAATGAAIGVILDVAEAAQQGADQAAHAAGKALHEHGPEVAAAIGTAIAGGAEHVRSADLPGKARDLALRVGHSGPADSARETAQNLAGSAREMGEKIADRAQGAVSGIRTKVGT